MKKGNPKVWTFSVPHVDGWFLVDGFSLIVEKRLGDDVIWSEKFQKHEDLLKYIHTNFPQLMPAVAV